MTCIRAGAVLIGLSLPLSLLTQATGAAERTLEFQLVTRDVESQELNAPNLKDQHVSQGKAFGVAVFKDGRLGVKEFIWSADVKKGDRAKVFGYSTYTFDDGSITARFASSTEHRGCDYQILSGTGAYAGATGTGTCDPIPNPFGTLDVGVYRVKLHIVTP